MAASAHLLLSALSKRPDDRPGGPSDDHAVTDPDDWHICVFHSESSCAQAPLTSEPPLPHAEPLTSEPPLAAVDSDTTRP
ncbi:hypothetical protein ACIQAC_37400 [Streptomyces sp. NPDC088387]|uniref:hypothetical protein n=1 Tax=Streptomyces sp. NPDC088387 TaxID=3365859 RepID=UPI0038172845